MILLKSFLFNAGLGEVSDCAPKTRVALVVQRAIGQLEGSQEVPHMSIFPRQDGVNTHKCGHPAATRAESVLLTTIWVSFAST